MVEKQKPRKGPVAEVGYIDTGGGEIRYSAEGWGMIVASRRMTAMRRIHSLCKKDLEAKITDEFTHDDVDTAYAGMEVREEVQRGLDHYKVAPFHHIIFECQPKTGAAQSADELAKAKAGAKTK